MKKKKILVFGCLRSGTTYANQILRSVLNLKTSHERISKDGGVGTRFAAKWKSVQFGLGWRPPLNNFEVIVWIYRNPLNNISSLAKTMENNNFLKIIGQHDPWYQQIRNKYDHLNPATDNQILDMCAAAWCSWNKVCLTTLFSAHLEGVKILHGQIEKQDWIISVANLLELPAPDENVINRLMKLNINHRYPHTPPTWNELKKIISPGVYEKVEAQAKLCGYLR